MKDCCERWLEALRPRKNIQGKFTERHKCKGCGREHDVLFEGMKDASGKTVVVTIGIR